MRVIHLAVKDLYQIVRDWKSALFLFIMPIGFTLMFGIAFSGGDADPRLPVAILNYDSNGILSRELSNLMELSESIRPVTDITDDEAALAQQVADGDLAALVIIPDGYTEQVRSSDLVPLRLIVDSNSVAGSTVESEIGVIANRLHSSVRAALLAVDAVGDAGVFEPALAQAVVAWQSPPFTVMTTGTGQDTDSGEEQEENPFAHSSAGMMAQFAIAGLIGAAEIVVIERRSRTLQRLLTTAISKTGVVMGHFLAMFVMILVQLLILSGFGHLVLDVPYFSAPLAILLMLFAFAFFIASLGMLIGALAKTEEMVIVLSLVPMFVLAALGGAWSPLEYTSKTFQTIGHLTPVAWAIDGLKNIAVRGLGLPSVLLPAAVLMGFGIACLGIAVWQFRVE